MYIFLFLDSHWTTIGFLDSDGPGLGFLDRYWTGLAGTKFGFFVKFCMFPVHAKIGLKWQEDFFPTNPDLAKILGRTDLYSESFYFFDFLASKFLDFQVLRFPEIWPGPGLTRVGPGLGQRAQSPEAPRQPRGTNFRRSKELGQDRENPISASPVWGMWAFRA